MRKLYKNLYWRNSQFMKGISLFANIGVAEAYLKELGIDIVIANEYDQKRADLYTKIYPKTNMVCGDFTNKEIFNLLVSDSKKMKIDLLIATPPCQGMSTAGQKKSDDSRNQLIIYILDFIEQVKPKFIFIENVPLFFKTKVEFNEEKILIPQLIHHRTSSLYNIEEIIIDTKNYSVPQSRQRAVILLSRKDQKIIWKVPPQDQKIITMKEAIGDIPIIDPFVKDLSTQDLLKLFPFFYERKKQALEISKWNIPPTHIYRQVQAMMHTRTGCSAFDNIKFKPVKENGMIIKGFKNTYKRQLWDSPAYTITMDNRKISSQNNVHPGRYIGNDKEGNQLYSDPRTLTLYEIMKIMTLPPDWPLPDNTQEAFVRRIIGEGIPPLFVKKVFQKLLTDLNQIKK